MGQFWPVCLDQMRESSDVKAHYEKNTLLHNEIQVQMFTNVVNIHEAVLVAPQLPFHLDVFGMVIHLHTKHRTKLVTLTENGHII